MSVKSVEHVPAFLEMNGTAFGDVAGQADRRNRIRTQVHCPVRFLRAGTMDVLETTTLNLSSAGFYCLIKSPVVPGESMACTLSLPAHQPHSTERRLLLECKVQITRVEAPDGDGLYGIGCRIEDYRFLHTATV
jgi:hypothetical protein